jgi:hypothetical protein
MRRREFITLIGGAAAWPFASSAQQSVPVVGYLSGRSANSETPLRTPFLKALEGAGFIVGQNVAIDTGSRKVGMSDCPVWRLNLSNARSQY